LFYVPNRLQRDRSRQAVHTSQSLSARATVFRHWETRRLHDPLHVIAGLGKRDQLDPVDRVDLEIARIAIALDSFFDAAAAGRGEQVFDFLIEITAGIADCGIEARDGANPMPSRLASSNPPRKFCTVTHRSTRGN
jgi:hypothetical protein